MDNERQSPEMWAYVDPQTSIMDLTHEMLKIELNKRETTTYENCKLVNAKDHIFGPCNMRNKIQIVKKTYGNGETEMKGFGVKANEDIKSGEVLGHYAGVFCLHDVSNEHDNVKWLSLGRDRAANMINSDKNRPNLRALIRNQTILMPEYNIHGVANKDPLEFVRTFDVDSYVNGNWSQFIDTKPSRNNCRISQNGNIIAVRPIKAGTELFANYSYPRGINRKQREVLEQVQPPSPRNINNSLWIYPEGSVGADFKIEVYADGEYWEVLHGKRFDYKGAYFPEIEIDDEGSPGICLVCSNGNQAKEVFWKRDVQYYRTVPVVRQATAIASRYIDRTTS